MFAFHSHPDFFTPLFEDVLSRTDEKFQGENRGFQKLHERHWTSRRHELAKSEEKLERETKVCHAKYSNPARSTKTSYCPQQTHVNELLRPINSNVTIKKHHIDSETQTYFSVKRYTSRLGIPLLFNMRWDLLLSTLNLTNG